MTNNQKAREIQFFFDSKWLAYRDFLELDLLNHQEFFIKLANHIQTNAPKNYSLLDLACGDCDPTSKMLKNSPCGDYVGVDNAGDVLKLGQENLKPITINNQAISLSLVEMDFIDYLKTASRSFDVILLSYSIHHLTTEDKQVVFNQAFKKLNKGGFFAVIDGMKLKNQSRMEWLELCYGYMEKKSQGRCEESCKTVKAHMIAADFPEEGQHYIQMAKLAGFATIELELKEVAGLGILFAHKS